MVAGLVRVFGPERLDLAEDVVQEALVQALRTWPFRGVPDNPGGWLVQVAKNRALDAVRRGGMVARKEEEVRAWSDALAAAPAEPDLDRAIEDDRLRLMFICCQPAVPREARVALTLKAVCGFGVSEIARAFLAKEATVAQRLVRAKHRIAKLQPAFEVPTAAELPAALDAVLEALYLMFNEGYAAHQGEDLVRREVCEEAIRLVRLVAAHPALDRPEVHALAALLLLQGARTPARVDDEGDLLLLPEQDRALWDRRMIRDGFAHLERAARGDRLTAWHLEAEIAACHTTAPSAATTDWRRILSIYESLHEIKPTPVVALNRAVALAMAEGPQAGLAAIEEIAGHPALDGYYLLPGVQGELWSMVGEPQRAAAFWGRALGMTCPEPVRRRLERRLAEAEEAAGPGR